MKNIFKISPLTKKILIGIFTIVAISFLVAYFYYDSKNKAEDPRIVQTKFWFKNFDDLLKESKYSEAIPLLDSIENIVVKVPGYKESYELGLVYNNRGSVYLSKALYTNIVDSAEIRRLLTVAKQNIDSSIVIYNFWLNKYQNLTLEQLSDQVKPYFTKNDEAFKGKNLDKIIQKRIDDLALAQKETPRRLSVCYTNLGIIQRHLYMQNKALESYIQAIKLWKDNYTARNNFNVLMGKPAEDRSIIDQLFPPEKNKFN